MRSGHEFAAKAPVIAGHGQKRLPVQRLSAPPAHGAGWAGNEILALQQTAGNRATSALVARLATEAKHHIGRAQGPVPYRATMEAFFGESFAGTRVATGVSELGRTGADGATIGDRVAFAAERPSKRLVAHELAHVVQNRRGAS